MMKKCCTQLLIVALFLGLTACGNKPQPPDDILTQTVPLDNKTVVTVLVKYAFSIHEFEQEAEKRFPNLDIIQVGNYTADMGIAEYEARLEHDDLTDIVMTWPLDVGEQYWEDRLLDLSSLPLSGKYTNIMLDSISRDGKLYYLPGPSQVRGIIYNKTLFKEKGWEVPSDFDGFIELCQTIEDDGMRSLQLGLRNAEVLDTAFVGYGQANSFSKPEDALWIADYNRGKGSFGDHFSSSLDTFQTLIDSSILKKEDLDVTYAVREQMLFTRQCAMVEDSVLMARMGFDRTGITDEFALMPFFNPGENSDWARLYPVCYIGLNKHLAEKQNKEKYDLVLQLLEYISTPEGQLALAGDTGGMFSSLSGMQPPNVPEIDDLVPALTNGRYSVFTTLKNAQNALRKGLTGMVEGTMTREDVIRLVDEENLSPPVKTPSAVLGTASKDFTLIETGNFITDIMREATGCVIALCLDNGKDGKTNDMGIRARIYQGDVTDADIRRIFSDTKLVDKSELWEVTMIGENLIKTLEYSIPVGNGQTGWFYYFSGLQMEYAPSAEPGNRIKKITDSKGNAIDPKKQYSIAVMGDIVPNDLTISRDKTEIFMPELLKQTIQSAETIFPSDDGRFTIYR